MTYLIILEYNVGSFLGCSYHVFQLLLFRRLFRICKFKQFHIISILQETFVSASEKAGPFHSKVYYINSLFFVFLFCILSVLLCVSIQYPAIQKSEICLPVLIPFINYIEYSLIYYIYKHMGQVDICLVN